MDDRQDTNAGTEARHDLAASPDRSRRHEEALRQYLRAAFYGDTRREREVLRDHDARPVDEPAPQVHPSASPLTANEGGDRYGVPGPVRRR